MAAAVVSATWARCEMRSIIDCWPLARALAPVHHLTKWWIDLWHESLRACNSIRCALGFVCLARENINKQRDKSRLLASKTRTLSIFGILFKILQLTRSLARWIWRLMMKRNDSECDLCMVFLYFCLFWKEKRLTRRKINQSCWFRQSLRCCCCCKPLAAVPLTWFRCCCCFRRGRLTKWRASNYIATNLPSCDLWRLLHKAPLERSFGGGKKN